MDTVDWLNWLELVLVEAVLLEVVDPEEAFGDVEEPDEVPELLEVGVPKDVEEPDEVTVLLEVVDPEEEFGGVESPEELSVLLEVVGAA
jgi:hypothetical protein